MYIVHIRTFVIQLAWSVTLTTLQKCKMQLYLLTRHQNDQIQQITQVR